MFLNCHSTSCWDCSALFGIVYLYTMHGVEGLFHKLRTPPYIKPALGGLGVGAIGYFVPQVLGQGYGWSQLAMAGRLSLGLVLTIALAKIAATSFTIGSGGSGGTSAPTVVIGGMLGTAVGLVLRQLRPGIAPSVPAFALVGMAGFLAGARQDSPLGTDHGFGDDHGLRPARTFDAGHGDGLLLSPRKLTLYGSQVGQRVDSPAHEGEYVSAALERIHVKEALPKDQKVVSFQRETPLPEILEEVSKSKQLVFPVLDDNGTSCRAVIDFPSIRVFYSRDRAVQTQWLRKTCFPPHSRS